MLLLVLPACGGGSSINPKEVGPCAPGRQITGQQLRAALRHEGFSAVCLKHSYGSPDVANLTPTANGGDRADHEGSVMCNVTRFMPPRTARHPHKVFEWNSIPTRSQPGRQLMLANIDCTLYLDPGTRPDAPLRIRRAFNSLAGARY